MGYCTQQNLIDRFGDTEIIQLADRDRDGEVDTEVVDGAIADAAAEIDGRLSAVLVLPAVAPNELVFRACDIARYRLYDDRATEVVRRRYEDAVAWLKDVAAGKAVIPGAVPTTSTSGAVVGGIAVGTSSRVFSDAVLAGMG
jgi:phage gp36-like protein